MSHRASAKKLRGDVSCLRSRRGAREGRRAEIRTQVSAGTQPKYPLETRQGSRWAEVRTKFPGSLHLSIVAVCGQIPPGGGASWALRGALHGIPVPCSLDAWGTLVPESWQPQTSVDATQGPLEGRITPVKKLWIKNSTLVVESEWWRLGPPQPVVSLTRLETLPFEE